MTSADPVALKSKRKRAKETDQVIEPTGTTGENKAQKKSKKVKEVIEPTADSIDAVPVKEKKSKKRKRELAEAADAPPEAIPNPEPPAKKRRNKTGFQDPSGDSELTDQAQKALEYAFMQFRKPKKWKFNKARQNWLVRNYWSSEQVPDAYTPLVIQYMLKMQGGAREGLVKSCETHLAPPKPKNVDVTSTSESKDSTEAKSTEEKDATPIVVADAPPASAQRARALLDALTSPTSS
ncbi:hypothetical protein CYLTODRAFT_397227 [Cylindrobasidium torrendii FP15055 ss-10]|uniref:WKF domain-containing protein n=1 Tax=Cylindrobasidium torrendii FP15055 ss-10 TaxID=1314674 RepID=A0A0D7BCR8_9AGAR|nr:hypothetical protein CYLTODRAFT_397227 [Cylindrobasidium torrendii FP15055 ss-10]